MNEEAGGAEDSTAHLLRSISRVQTRLISDPSHPDTFRIVLEEIVTLSHSGCGFIGELRMSDQEAPVLKIHATANGAGQE